jgi:hypothetical protein
MKRLCRVVYLAIIMIISIGCTSAFAADWYCVGTSDNGEETAYIDNASVEKNNRWAIVWIKWVVSDGTCTVSRCYITHTPKTTTALSLTKYDSNGNIECSGEIPPYMRTTTNIVPGSMGESIWYCIWAY